MQKIYILTEGYAGERIGIPLAAFTTRANLRKFVKTEYSEAKLVKSDNAEELYWQVGDLHLRCGESIFLIEDNESAMPLD
jgi:hypothetical protein